MKILRGCLTALFLAACAQSGAQTENQTAIAPPSPPTEHWVSIFNGVDLDGWTPKFAHHALGENVDNIFRVEGGVLKVSYDDFEGSWRDEFGHIFYKEPFGDYRLRLEYRFVGEAIPGAQSWTLRNSGVMLHSQPPETMELDQFFPISMEAQFLGEGANAAPTTANLCTPGMSVLLNGERSEEHCFHSTAPSLPMGEWVRFEAEVRNGQVRHFVNGRLALSYSEPMTDEVHPWAPDRRLTRGYIALQAEAHAVEFRNIEILTLAP
jgi:hypothetical protein